MPPIHLAIVHYPIVLGISGDDADDVVAADDLSAGHVDADQR